MRKLVLAVLLLVLSFAFASCGVIEGSTASASTPPSPRQDGLFDRNGERLASWDELVNNYGFDVEKDDEQETSPFADIIERNEEALGDGVKLVVGDGVRRIGRAAFRKCAGLTIVELPESLTSIGDFAFSLCTGLENVYIPKGVTSIGEAAFEGCKFTTITLPERLTDLGDGAFSSCAALTSISIPDGVSSVGYSVFYSCYNLASVELPASVMSIGVLAFANCPMLQTVTVRASTVPPCDLSSFEDCFQLASIYVPAELVDAYKTAEGWSDFADAVKPIQ